MGAVDILAEMLRRDGELPAADGAINDHLSGPDIEKAHDSGDVLPSKFDYGTSFERGANPCI
jgi:hypothetical protein